jgi:purine-binding chemotaxis protein CheW
MPNANLDTELKENVALTQKPKSAPIPEAQLVQLVVFVLEDETFGADINQVREIMRVGTITPIPDSPQFIKGVANVRGEIIIVIDLKSRFFLQVKKPAEPKHIVITDQEGNLYGLLVDEVTEVLRIPKPEIKTTPHLITKIDRSYVSGVITLENRLIMLLDFKRVLSEEELNKLARLTTTHKEQPIPEAANLPEQPTEIPLKERPASTTKIVRAARPAAKKALPERRRRGAR